MRPFLTNPTKRVFSASASAVVSLASVCSISLLAGAAVTLTSLISAREASAAFAKTDAVAVRGELVLWVPSGIGPTRVDEIADKANCTVVTRATPTSQFYLLRLKGASEAIIRDAKNRPTLAIDVPSPEVLAAVAAIKNIQPDALADPNVIRRPSRQQASAPVITPNDPFYGEQWDKRMINMPAAWKFQNGSRPVIVADIDTGFDVGHPDFFRGGTPVFVDPINTGFDFTVGPAGTLVPDNTCYDGHGVHTAGTIAAVTDNTVGVASVAGYGGFGVNIKLLPIKASTHVFVDGPDTDTDPDHFEEPFFLFSTIAAVQQAVAGGATAINMSLGGAFFSSVEAQAIADAINAGVVVVAASGNESSGADLFPSYPANYPGVINVTAVNNQRQLSSYSNYGGSVTIAAPGGDFGAGTPADSLILSTIPTAGIFNEIFLGQPTTIIKAPGYAYMAGTSMACPQVTGAVALLAAGGASSAEIPGILIDTATPLPNPNVRNQFNGEPITAQAAYGAGLLNVGRALLPRIRFLGGSDIGVSDSLGSSASDLGVTYFRRQSFDISIGGIGNLIREASVPETSLTYRIEEATNPTTPVQSATITGSLLPVPGTGETPFVTKAFPLPITSIRLGQNRYKAVLTLNYRGITTTQTQFFEVLDYRQTSGLSLFSVPFKPAATVAPEQSVLTLNSGFALFRRDPLNILGPSNEGYYRYQPNEESAAGNDESIARFTTRLSHTQDPLHTNRSLVPLSYAAGNPAVSLAPIGVGYWLNMSDAKVLETDGVPTTSPVAIPLFGVEDDQGEFRTASDGWNMIGAPFAYPVNWSAVTVRQQTPVGVREYSLQEAVAAEIINAQLVGWDVPTRSYFYNVAPSGQLLPFHGYWVRALKDCTLVVPPSRATPSLTSRAVDVKATAPQTEGWRVRLSASVAGDRDAENYFGQVRGAADGEDSNDVQKPPTGPSNAYVRFINTDKKGRKAAYAFDMRPTTTGRQKSEWTVAVGAGKGDTDVTLTWDGLRNMPTRSKLALRDSVTNKVISMNGRSSYTYKNTEAGATRLFTISLATQNSAGPLQIRNVQTVTNAVGRAEQRGINVRFSLSQDADVQASVRTLSGKVVNVLSGATRGVSQDKMVLRWNGRSREGSEVPSGPYILEITARTDEGETVTVKRPITYLQ